MIETFEGRGCTLGGPTIKTGYPVFDWSCQSSAGGDCYSAPYNILSFQIGPGFADNGYSPNAKCYTDSTDNAMKDGLANIGLAFVGVIWASLLALV